MRLKVCILATLFSVSSMQWMEGQETSLTLETCYSAAINNYPSMKDRENLQRVSSLKLENMGANYLPQISLNGQATYQSDAISISIPFPANPVSIHQSKDQYKVSLDVNQLIYDGGITKSQKNLEEASLGSDLKQVEVDLYKVKEQVNNVYFLILSLQETKRLLGTTLADITERQKVVTASVKNGVLTPADFDNMEAERLKVEQQLFEAEFSRTTAIKILSLYLGKPLTDSIKLELPSVVIVDSAKSQRPEYALFESQQKRLDASKSITNSTLRPRVSAFAQSGYGRPGLNMLDDQFNAFYIVGANVKWNLWDWSKGKRDRQAVDIQKKMIDTRRETFDRNLSVDFQNRLSVISKLEEAIKRDSAIVTLRGNVARNSASRLDNGTITSTDYVTDLNAETLARINLENHKIQLQQARANYLLAKGQ